MVSPPNCFEQGERGSTADRFDVHRKFKRESDPMRAVVHDKYGSPDVLRMDDVERPMPNDDEVLVKIHATTVNRSDCGYRSAEFFITRFFTGLSMK